MGVLTRKRAAGTVEEPAPHSSAKRSRTAQAPPAAASPSEGSPQGRREAGSPAPNQAKQSELIALKKGSRGAAFLAAAGIAVPPSASPLPGAASPPKLSTKKASAAKAARLVAGDAPAPLAAPRSAAKPRNPLLGQELPRKLAALLDMFAGLQTVYEMMRRRGQRTTYQHMRQAVEEASGRRFLMAHVAQLQHLLPEALVVEWVRLPVAAHSSRTEPHLLLSLDGPAAARAAADAGAAAPGSGEMRAARDLVQCRLAGHLLGSYRTHLGAQAMRQRQAGDEAAAAALEAAAAAAQRPPVAHFVAPYPEEAADVPQQQLPPRPEAPAAASRGGSPAILGATAAPAAAAQQLAVPLTPATLGAQPQPSTGRHGRPPMHPSTIDRQRQRRLSFSQPAAASAGLAAPSAAAPASCRGPGKPGTPLDKLSSQLDRQHQRRPEEEEAAEAAAAAAQVHPSQAALAASLGPAGLQFGCAAAVLSGQDACLLASMPQELRRLSTEGIISMDTLRKLDAAEQQHRRLSSKEAVERRDSNAALGQLPRTFSRLQRIFGMQGPNALKLRDVVLRIKQGGEEMSTEGQIEAQVRALAEHAPEYVSLKAYGRCGTPAVWINRACSGNAIMHRLKQVADGRLAQRGEAA